jgi:hypothetical protein
MFRNQEIAIVYDPPHLLKCTRNMFLEYNVQLKSEVQGNHLLVAKWDHILKFYELAHARACVCKGILTI